MTNKELEKYFHTVVVWITAQPSNRRLSKKYEYMWLETMGLIETAYITSCG